MNKKLMKRKYRKTAGVALAYVVVFVMLAAMLCASIIFASTEQIKMTRNTQNFEGNYYQIEATAQIAMSEIESDVRDAGKPSSPLDDEITGYFDKTAYEAAKPKDGDGNTVNVTNTTFWSSFKNGVQANVQTANEAAAKAARRSVLESLWVLQEKAIELKDAEVDAVFSVDIVGVAADGYTEYILPWRSDDPADAISYDAGTDTYSGTGDLYTKLYDTVTPCEPQTYSTYYENYTVYVYCPSSGTCGMFLGASGNLDHGPTYHGNQDSLIFELFDCWYGFEGLRVTVTEDGRSVEIITGGEITYEYTDGKFDDSGVGETEIETGAEEPDDDNVPRAIAGGTDPSRGTDMNQDSMFYSQNITFVDGATKYDGVIVGGEVFDPPLADPMNHSLTCSKCGGVGGALFNVETGVSAVMSKITVPADEGSMGSGGGNNGLVGRTANVGKNKASSKTLTLADIEDIVGKKAHLDFDTVFFNGRNDNGNGNGTKYDDFTLVGDWSGINIYFDNGDPGNGRENTTMILGSSTQPFVSNNSGGSKAYIYSRYNLKIDTTKGLTLLNAEVAISGKTDPDKPEWSTSRSDGLIIEGYPTANVSFNTDAIFYGPRIYFKSQRISWSGVPQFYARVFEGEGFSVISQEMTALIGTDHLRLAGSIGTPGGSGTFKGGVVFDTKTDNVGRQQFFGHNGGFNFDLNYSPPADKDKNDFTNQLYCYLSGGNVTTKSTYEKNPFDLGSAYQDSTINDNDIPLKRRIQPKS